MNRAIAALAFLSVSWAAQAHDIYTGLHGKDKQLCCGGNDCAVTHFREQADHYEFKTRDGAWVAIPQDRITFLPIPGEQPVSDDDDDAHRAHLCYRPATEGDKLGAMASNVFGPIYLYCAFIPPGAI
jgi:hypothetical protein